MLCPGECMSETPVPAAPGFSMLRVWQSPRCQQYSPTMSLHKASSSSQPSGLCSRIDLIEIVVS